jgi:hypothetical protein
MRARAPVLLALGLLLAGCGVDGAPERPDPESGVPGGLLGGLSVAVTGTAEAGIARSN